MLNIMYLKKISILFIILPVILLLIPACGSNRAGTELPSSEEAEEKGRELSVPPPRQEIVSPNLDSALNQLVLAEKRGEAESFARQGGIELVDGKVRVQIECLPGQVEAAVKVAAAVGIVESSSRRLNMVGALVPITSLEALANEESIRFIALPVRGVPEVVSQGVALIKADKWHTSFNGTGVKVGIIDAGFSGIVARQQEGELPASITTWWAPSINGTGTDPHGTACAEIVYDIAPGAQFYVANYLYLSDFDNAVDWFIAQGVKVISNSTTFPAYGPGDGGGPIGEIVDAAYAANITWAQAVGNYAKQHWQGDFVDSNHNGFHEFSGTYETNPIEVSTGDKIEVFLNWNDPWGGSGNDYGLALYNQDVHLVKWANTVQNGNDNPYEELFYTANYTGTYHIAIYTNSNPQVVNFNLYARPADLYYKVAARSFAVPADSANALAVGAVHWNYPTVAENFSSRGPTKDGRIKPDLVAPDGVSTATYGASNGQPYESGGTGFFGTSASAPHAAGAAVLVKQRYSSYNVTQIQGYLETYAIPLGDPGKDNIYGSGRLYLPYMEAETSLTQELEDPNNRSSLVLVPVSIDRVKNDFTGETISGVGIGAYAANATYFYDPPDGMEMVTVRDGDSPFNDPVFTIHNNDPGDDWTEFSQDPTGGAAPIIIVARLVPRLIGCALNIYDLTVNFNSIKATTEEAILQESPAVVRYKRGDANGSNTTNIIDSLIIKQYLVEQVPFSSIKALNAASPNHDGASGDKITISDALAIEQYIVGQLNCYFEWIGGLTSSFMPITAGEVTVEIGSAEISPDRSIAVPITVKGIPVDSTGLGGYVLRLTFDPEMVTVEDITLGKGAFTGKPVFNINNIKGEVLLVGTHPEIPGATGDVTVAYVTLRAKGRSGDSSKLDISVIDLVGSLGDSIAAKDIDGKVVVK